VIAVTGATGYTGSFLVSKLATGEEKMCCLVRPGTDAHKLEALGVEIARIDLDRPKGMDSVLREARVVLHLAHIRYARAVLEGIGARVERIVLVSSLRRFSSVPDPTVAEVVAAEAQVLSSSLPWVLLRPSMIYGPGDDRNISRLVARLRRNRTLPIPGSGQHRHQPVFVGDVVAGILSAATTAGIEGRAYALAGAEALSYDALVDAIGAVIGVPPRKVHLPPWLVLWGISALRWLGIRMGIEPGQVRRLQEDKVYSIAAAKTDLAFEPLTFVAGLDRIYGRQE